MTVNIPANQLEKIKAIIIEQVLNKLHTEQVDLTLKECEVAFHNIEIAIIFETDINEVS